MNADEALNGKLPVEFQCKTTISSINYSKLLSEMPGEEYRCILHRQTQKDSAGRFQVKGEYAILPLEDFYEILKNSMKDDIINRQP